MFDQPTVDWVAGTALLALGLFTFWRGRFGLFFDEVSSSKSDNGLEFDGIIANLIGLVTARDARGAGRLLLTHAFSRPLSPRFGARSPEIDTRP